MVASLLSGKAQNEERGVIVGELSLSLCSGREGVDCVGDKNRGVTMWLGQDITLGGGDS